MDTIDEFMAFISFVIGFIYWLSNRVSKLIMERPISQIHQLIPLRSLKRVPQVKLINFLFSIFYENFPPSLYRTLNLISMSNKAWNALNIHNSYFVRSLSLEKYSGARIIETFGRSRAQHSGECKFFISYTRLILLCLRLIVSYDGARRTLEIPVALHLMMYQDF